VSRIELVIETHFHADFLSGHLELARPSGRRSSIPRSPTPEFASTGMSDGQRHSMGEVTLEFRHTPGHTPESMSMVVYAHAGDATLI
jgi:hydroxyacylglutathione hydrolase